VAAGEVVLLHDDHATLRVLVSPPLLHAQLLCVVARVVYLSTRLGHTGGSIGREHALRKVARLQVDLALVEH
jgi:hypothetical protein